MSKGSSMPNQIRRLAFFFFIIILVQRPVLADGVSPTDGLGGMFNKALAAITDLSFRSDQAYSLLVPNDINFLISAPQVVVGSRQHARHISQAESMQRAMTTGIGFVQVTNPEPMCVDVGSKMQGIYNYYVFPLNTHDQNNPAPTCLNQSELVSLNATLDQKFTTYVSALKTIWTDELRVASCPFNDWKAAYEGSTIKCHADDAWVTAYMSWKDLDKVKETLQAALHDQKICSNNCNKNTLYKRISLTINQIENLNKMSFPMGSDGKCYIASNTFCANWLKNNWLTLTAPLSDAEELLNKIVKGYIASVQYVTGSASSDELDYSIDNLLNPNGYKTNAALMSAKKLVQIAGNSTLLPSIILPSSSPVSYDATSNTCSIKNMFYADGGQAGGDFSVHSPKANTLVSCGLLTRKGASVSDRISIRNEAYQDMLMYTKGFQKNMRTLLSGQTLLLSNFYDAIARRVHAPYVSGNQVFSSNTSTGKFLRPDWRSSNSNPTTSINQDSGQSSNPQPGDGAAWRALIKEAPPSVVKRETLFVLADIISALYQTELIEERVLLTTSYAALQGMSGSGLVQNVRFYKKEIAKDIYRSATGSTEITNAINSKNAPISSTNPSAEDMTPGGAKNKATSQGDKKADAIKGIKTSGGSAKYNSSKLTG
jgi:hypothetical protein